MRRTDREVKDPVKILKIIDSCDTCRLGLMDDHRVYMVPLSFGYTCIGGIITFYFHSAAEGKKLELLRKSEEVAFQLDTAHLPLTGMGCKDTMLYQSVFGYGIPRFLDDPEEKRLALRHLIAHYNRKQPALETDFPDIVMDKTCVFCVMVKELTCKENR